MSGHTAAHTPQPASVGEYVRHGDYRLAAQQMVRHLGDMAAAGALDREAQALYIRNAAESGFWARVCREIIALQTVGQAARQAPTH